MKDHGNIIIEVDLRSRRAKHLTVEELVIHLTAQFCFTSSRTNGTAIQNLVQHF